MAKQERERANCLISAPMKDDLENQPTTGENGLNKEVTQVLQENLHRETLAQDNLVLPEGSKNENKEVLPKTTSHQ